MVSPLQISLLGAVCISLISILTDVFCFSFSPSGDGARILCDHLRLEYENHCGAVPFSFVFVQIGVFRYTSGTDTHFRYGISGLYRKQFRRTVCFPILYYLLIFFTNLFHIHLFLVNNYIFFIVVWYFHVCK